MKKVFDADWKSLRPSPREEWLSSKLISRNPIVYDSTAAKDEKNFHLVIVNDDLESAYVQFRKFLVEKYASILQASKKYVIHFVILYDFSVIL